MRILFCWSYYEQYLNSFYAENLDFYELSYQEQIRLIKLDYFGVPGSYSIWSERFGHDCELVINNCEPMQRRWAFENNIPFAGDWQRMVAIEQVKQFQPDVFFMGSMFHLYGDFLDEVKKYSRKVVGWIACPIPRGISLNQMDVILSSSPQFVSDFQKNGIQSERVIPAFDPDILKLLEISNSEPEIPFSFVGGVTRHHKDRYKLLTQLIEKTHMELWGYGVKPQSIKEMLMNLLSGRHLIDPVVQRYRGEVWGVKMFKILNRSKITFNSHIDIAGEWCGNTRMFEATGAGTLLLTDNKKNVSELFEPGAEVVVYKSAEDAAEKVQYYLTHEEERRGIAEAGQKRTLVNYNMKDHVNRIINIFSNL